MTKINLKLILLAGYSMIQCASINDLPDSALQKVCEFFACDKSLSRRHSEISQPLSKQCKAHLVQLINNFNKHRIDTKVFVHSLSLYGIHLLEIKPVRSFFMHFQNIYRLEINQDGIKKLDECTALNDKSWSRLISFLQSEAECHKFCDDDVTSAVLNASRTNERSWEVLKLVQLLLIEKKLASKEHKTTLRKLFDEKSLMKKLNRYLGKDLYHEKIKNRLFRQGSFGPFPFDRPQLNMRSGLHFDSDP
jgi:hypothetical protein